MASPATDAQAEDALLASTTPPEESHVAEQPVASANRADDDNNGGDAVVAEGSAKMTTTTTIQPLADQDDDDEEDATSNAPSQEDELEDGEVDGSEDVAAAPPLPDGPPLPSEPIPDDGWDCQLDPTTQTWFFYNRFTGKTQWDNPRMPTSSTTTTTTTIPSAVVVAVVPQPPSHEQPAAGGYNPAIHGDYDPNAWYAKGAGADDDDDEQQQQQDSESLLTPAVADSYAATVAFNRHSGGFQTEEMGPGRHSDDSKARRQMNAYFDAETASASHDGRSLRAERQNKKPSKSEVKAFKEKRRARKEEKRRAWLRD